MSRGRLKRALSTLWRQHATPDRLAFAVALGVLVGSTPLFGLHTLISLGLAFLFSLNKFAVVLGSQISTPPLIVPVVYSALQLGSHVISGRWLGVSFTELNAASLPELAARFALYWATGGAMVGAILGAIVFFVTRALARRYQARKKAQSALDPAPSDAPE